MSVAGLVCPVESGDSALVWEGRKDKRVGEWMTDKYRPRGHTNVTGKSQVDLGDLDLRSGRGW